MPPARAASPSSSSASKPRSATFPAVAAAVRADAGRLVVEVDARREERGAELLGLVAALYGIAIAVGALGLLLTRGPGGALDALVGGARPRQDLLLGLGFGLLLPVLSRFLVYGIPAFAHVEAEIGRWLGPISTAVATRLAILSGLGEELVFRGLLQPELGLALTSMLFGLAHLGPDPRFLAWTAWATVAGGLFGWMAEHTGSLLAPIVAHVTVNYLGLLWIGARLEARRAAPLRAGP